MTAWDQIEAEARDAFHGAGKFPLRAYSEFMPSPYIGVKPAPGARGRGAGTFGIAGDAGLEIDEYEQAYDLEPGLDRIAERLVEELTQLSTGISHGLSRALVTDNPAWPDELAAAAKAKQLGHDPMILVTALALSRTQDDKGNSRWTLFGASHDGPDAAFWRGIRDEDHLKSILVWMGQHGEWHIHSEQPGARDIPTQLHARLLTKRLTRHVKTLVTFVPFARLPEPVRAAYLAGELVLVPTPSALVFHEHPRYRALEEHLPRATQIPLLHVFPRIEQSCAIRVPQSGYLDEHDPGQIARTHRWQRVARDADMVRIHGDGAYTDRISTALFATTPEAVDLYDKPLGRNVQIWSAADYSAVLDGPHADRAQLARAAGLVDAGGRFGYRMYYPPMRAGVRDVFWHVPLVATAEGRHRELAGYATAERDGHHAFELAPVLLAREPHVIAARQFERDPGHARHTTSQNARKLLEAAELHGGEVPRALARSLLHCAKHESLEDWLAKLPERAATRADGETLARAIGATLVDDGELGAPHLLGAFATRAVEEQIWRSIAGLAHGEFRQKNSSDGITVNTGRTGGPAAKLAGILAHERRDLEALGDHLHDRYRALIEAAGMQGRAECVDHVFKWETDFDFPWMEGWAKNQTTPGGAERNVVCVIPGNNRGEAVVMGDHYDTAYMEDVFYQDTGGDYLRAPACGADDNHSATTALLLAAEYLLPLAKAGKLERDVWLVHLTGEEFPPDCLGARALGQALVERSLSFTAEDGSKRDVGDVRVVAAFVLDMIGHNSDRDRDVFQIAAGEGAGSARIARRALAANLKWNALAAETNRADDRRGLPRAQRIETREASAPPPPPFACLPLHGEVRVEWEPRSALYNTDGQIFSDLGIPVVLFMENYDISRKGYHDTKDTMENIDLDYCAAVTAIAIETVADCAMARTL